MKSKKSYFSAAILMIVALAIGISIFLLQTWISGRDAGILLQREIDTVFSRREIDGYALVQFYDERVVIHSESIAYDDMEALATLMKARKWVKLVDCRQTELTETEISDLSRQFAPVLIVGNSFKRQ